MGQLLNLDFGLKEKALDQVARFDPQIKSIASVGMVQKDIPMTITLEKRKLKVTCNSYPCYSEDDHFIGVVISFSEKSSGSRVVTQ